MFQTSISVVSCQRSAIHWCCSYLWKSVSSFLLLLIQLLYPFTQPSVGDHYPRLPYNRALLIHLYHCTMLVHHKHLLREYSPDLVPFTTSSGTDWVSRQLLNLSFVVTCFMVHVHRTISASPWLWYLPKRSMWKTIAILSEESVTLLS